MEKEAFKAWLEAGGAKTEAGRNTRAYAVLTIENNLAALGSPHSDLASAWNADRFEHLRLRLKKLRENFAAGGQDYRILMPQSDKPDNRLSSWRSWLGQYGQFLSGEPRGDRDADRIRRHVLEEYIEPARERDSDSVDVLVREVNGALNLNQGWPNICQALQGPKFLEMADVSPPEQIGKDQSSATVFRFTLKGPDDAVVEAGHARPFLLFDASGATFKPVRNFNRTTGRSAYRVKPPGASNKADDAIDLETLADVARAMLVDGRPARVQSVNGGTVNYIAYGKQKLVRYELDPTIAAEIGVPPQGEVAGASPLDLAVLERLRQLFLEKHPDFRTFVDNGSFGPAEDDYKRALIGRANELVAEQPDAADRTLGAELLDLIAGKGGFSSNLLGWRMADGLGKVRLAHGSLIEAAAGRLARDDDPIAGLEKFLSTCWPLLAEGQEASLPYGDSRTIPTMLRGLVDPKRIMGIRSTPTDNASMMLRGRRAFSQQLTADQMSDVMAMAAQVFTIMRDEWHWQPRDFWDVQGFIWETCQKRLPASTEQPVQQPERQATMAEPTNLILYGPPGTGKTYATAAEAVRLCGEAVPDEREALMAAYRSLYQKGRIGFVTFHQNFSYEDFVEGLRPVTGNADEGTEASSGFSLQAQDGIFKQIADVAASNRGKAVSSAAPLIDRTRKIFKMSLGRSWASEDDPIYQDAIREGYVVLGWGGDVDWSDPRYDEWDAIKERWRRDHPTASGNDPNLSQMYAFRINMQIGSLVVVSDGNRKFRAIGEITGPYRFVPGPNSEYNHRRAVRWLWHSDESLPRERIYGKELSQVSAYQMNSRNVNWDGLEQIVASGGDAVATSGTPEPHVLIIDEINRANISKVFGELITLLEPDKRIGMANELTVRLPYSKTEFGVPANLHIIGTMNTADRSIALLDTALRRRFEFRELMPRPSLLGTIDSIDLAALLTTINERIEYLFDREHQIGHAYFMGCDTRSHVDEVMRHKVIPLLAEYFYEDWAKVAMVLGDGDDGEGDREGGFIDRRRLKAPKGLNDDEDAAPRYRWIVRDTFSYAAFQAV